MTDPTEALDRLEALAKAAAEENHYTGPWDKWIASAYDVPFAQADFIGAASPDVVLRLIAAARSGLDVETAEYNKGMVLLRRLARSEAEGLERPPRMSGSVDVEEVARLLALPDLFGWLRDRDPALREFDADYFRRKAEWLLSAYHGPSKSLAARLHPAGNAKKAPPTPA